MDVVIKGSITIKQHGLLKHKPVPGSYGVLHDSVGSRGVPRLEMFHAEDEASPSVTLQLENMKFCDKMYLNPESKSFNVVIKKEKYQFQCDSDRDKEDWVQSLCHVSKELWTQRASSLPSSTDRASDSSAVPMNDNFLYDSCSKAQMFKVSVSPTRASKANKLEGHYVLSPTPEALLLLEVDTCRNVHEWPYRAVRKYGRTRQIFKMEVGRKCTTGEGEFEFFTPDGSTLVEWITIYMRQVRQEHTGLEGEITTSASVRSPDSPGTAAVPPRVYPRLSPQPQETGAYATAHDSAFDRRMKFTPNEGDHNGMRVGGGGGQTAQKPGSNPASPINMGNEETYDRLGNFSRQATVAVVPENVYGMASGKETVPSRPPPSRSPAREVEDEYVNTLQASAGVKAARKPPIGDYEDIL